ERGDDAPAGAVESEDLLAGVAVREQVRRRAEERSEVLWRPLRDLAGGEHDLKTVLEIVLAHAGGQEERHRVPITGVAERRVGARLRVADGRGARPARRATGGERRRDEYGAKCVLRAHDERRLDGGSACHGCLVRHALTDARGLRVAPVPNVPTCCLNEPKTGELMTFSIAAGSCPTRGATRHDW